MGEVTKLNWILKNIFECIANLVDGIIETVTVELNTLFQLAANLGNEDSINSLELFTSGLAFTLLTIFVMKQIFSTYIMETDGDPDSDPLDLIMRASVAIALIINNANIFNLFLGMSQEFGAGMFTNLAGIKITTNPFDSIPALLIGEITKVSEGLIFIFALIFVIGTIILFIKGAIRGAELCIMKILFPFFCCDYVTSKRERFNAFMTSYLVTFFGYVIQIQAFRISGHHFSIYVGAQNYIYELLYAYAFLYLAIKAPKWLEKFVYTTGLGQTVGGGARSAAFMVPSLLRGLK